MPSIEIGGLSTDEIEALEQAADEVNMTTAGFCRTRLRAGHRLWNAGGEFDVLEFQQRLEGRKSEPTTSTSTSTAKPATTSKQDRFRSQIKRNLPTNETDAVSKAELIEVVSEDIVNEVLADLKNEGEIEYVLNPDGFIRVD